MVDGGICIDHLLCLFLNKICGVFVLSSYRTNLIPTLQM